MDRLRILVANEPRSYREAMSGALKELCPDAEVLAVEPGELDRKIRQGASGMVLCSRITPAVERLALSWVELYPDGRPGARIGLNGLRLTAAEGLGLPDLLWIADSTRALSRENGHNGSR